jgi:hypothetical protein
MEHGGLTGQIPTKVGLLQELIFIALNFNQLIGRLSSEILSLRKFTQFMPDYVFLLVQSANLNGNPTLLIANCRNLDPKIVYNCCINPKVQLHSAKVRGYSQ